MRSFLCLPGQTWTAFCSSFVQPIAAMTAAIQAELPILAIVGDVGVGRKTLLSRILGRPLAPGSEAAIWDIDTRYYTAQAQCQILNVMQATSLQEPEAVILVCTGNQQANFRSCQQWASTADLASVEVRLCVANQFDRLQNSGDELDEQNWVEDCREWCSEHCYEYIEVCTCY